MLMSTPPDAGRDRSGRRFPGDARRVDTHMTELETTAPDTDARPSVLTDVIRLLLDGPHLAVIATVNADGSPQTSVVFVVLDGDDVLFSTIRGRRKMTNLQRDQRVELLVHRMPVGADGTPYATIAGPVELSEDPDGAFHREVYGRYMGGATPPPEPGAERVVVRLRPLRVYRSPWG
jgi:PPOX class probable F420-dependent enzyme